MKRRRLLITGVLLLLGGAIVNVAVAWGFSVRPVPTITYDGFHLRSDVRERLNTMIYRGFAELWLSQQLVGERWWNHPPFMHRIDEDAYQSLLPSGSLFRNHEPVQRYRPTQHDGVWWVTFEERSTGWPFLSLAAHRATKWAGGSSTIVLDSSGVQLTDAASQGHIRALPLRPLWPGFAINTIFYAAMLWVLFFVPGMVRRRIRRRRGLCPACAYPTWGGGSSPVCTECGKPL